MLVDIGETVHVIERRLFDTDVRRHFFGEVERVEAGAIRVRGYVFTYDSALSQYVRSDGERTRILPLGVSGFIINVAPPEIKADAVHYALSDKGRLVVTDGQQFSLDINEFGRMR
jgi:hypothetical protein